MTREVDALIAANAAGNTGCYAGYTTNGAHTVGSFHEREGTNSSSGPIGLAVDFDAYNNAARLRACADLFLTYQSQLAELFYTPLGYGIKYGQRCANVDGHTDHVHVAVNKGVFLTPANQPAPKPEEDMQPTFTVSCPTGGYWVVRRSDGGVYGYGPQGQTSGPGVAPTFGSMSGKPMAAPVAALGYHRNQQGIVDGYWLLGEDGGVFAFGAAPYTDSYAGHTAWHGGSRYMADIVQHDPGYDIISVEPNTDPPKIDAYDLSAGR